MSLEATVAGSSNLVQDIVVFFSSMLPFIENKGSILLAAALNMKWYISYAETTIGSFLPVPFLIMVGKRGLQRLRSNRIVGKFIVKVDTFAEKHADFLHKHAYLAMTVIISIPFTGIGCWAGALLSNILSLDRKRACGAIFAGVIVSGLITCAGAYGLSMGIRHLLRF